MGKTSVMSEPQWPVMPTPDPYDEPVEPSADGTGLFAVMIEESEGSGGNLIWNAAPAPPRQAMASRNRAREHAAWLAKRYTPRHPRSEQSRAAYRISPDQYLTIVQGATMGFSFRVTVVEVL